MTPQAFWHLKRCEFEALRRVYVISRGGTEAADKEQHPLGSQSPDEKMERARWAIAATHGDHTAAKQYLEDLERRSAEARG